MRKQPASISRAMASLLLMASLARCVSYEPATLVPALNLTAEDISLIEPGSSSDARIDFGLELGLNESDSLSNIEILPGVRVRGVAENGPSDSAGIQLGDIILSINGSETNHPDVVAAIQRQESASAEFLFHVRRNTVVFEASVIPREIRSNPAPRELYRADPLATRAGYRTQMIRLPDAPAMAAAQVVETFAESPLGAASINIDDYILAVNGQPLNSAQDLINRLNTEFELGQRVAFSVYDGETVSQREVQLWDPGRRISEVTLGPLFRYQSSLAPDSDSVSILDFWLFSLYSYTRVDEESTHSILGLINFSSDIGELIEEGN